MSVAALFVLQRRGEAHPSPCHHESATDRWTDSVVGPSGGAGSERSGSRDRRASGGRLLVRGTQGSRTSDDERCLRASPRRGALGAPRRDRQRVRPPPRGRSRARPCRWRDADRRTSPLPAPRPQTSASCGYPTRNLRRARSVLVARSASPILLATAVLEASRHLTTRARAIASFGLSMRS